MQSRFLVRARCWCVPSRDSLAILIHTRDGSNAKRSPQQVACKYIRAVIFELGAVGEVVGAVNHQTIQRSRPESSPEFGGPLFPDPGLRQGQANKQPPQGEHEVCGDG